MVEPDLESGLGSAELLDFLGDEMEVDRAPPYSYHPVSSIPAMAVQCSDHSPDPQDAASPTTLNRSYRLCLYDKHHFHRPKRSVAEEIQSTMNCLRRYEVTEPIGCAMLLSSDGTPDSPDDLTSVGTDVETISGALEAGGWDILCKTSELHSRALQEQLSALGREKQLRYLGRQKRDLADYSIFLLYYTGHGNAEGVVLNDGELFRYKNIVTKVAEVPCLRNKPKIFIFDSCRKRKLDHAVWGSLVTSKNLHFSTELENAYLQEQNSHQSYPPPHTMICFSAAEGRASFLDKVEGSFYTLALSHALRQFGSEWSFHEVITQVNGGTQQVAQSCEEVQNPIFKSNLEKLLVLNTSFRDDYAERDGKEPTTTPLSERQYLGADSLVVGKGVIVERDMIPKDPKVKPVWKSKEHVMDNISRLGNGVSVFFIYAPNPDTPHKPILAEDKWELRNRFLMSRLFFDLEIHGFHVLSDLHLGNTEPDNWVQWYVTRISQCNFVVFVCSPAFKELFEESPQVEKLANPKARRLVEYRNAVYAGISNEISKEGRRKFIPVILDNYQNKDCVPLLFQPGTVYRVPKEDRRRFDFDNKSRDFEKLISHMAGINRNDLERVTPLSQVPTLPGPFDKKMDLWSDDLEESLLMAPPRGYVLPGEPSYQGLVGSPKVASGGIGRGQSTETTEVTGGYHAHHRIGTSPPIASSQAPPMHGQQPHPQPQQPSQQLPQRYYPHPHPQTRPLQQPPASGNDLNSLPLKTPNSKIYLWLSKEISSWKFVARDLGVAERDLEIIVADYRVGGTDEQCYQMFLMWEQRFGGNGCNYRTLGEVLRDSDKNRHLYAEYVERVKTIEKLQ